jgi:hypothetical protein
LLLLNRDTNKPQATADERAAALTGLASGGFIAPGSQATAAQLAVILTGGPETGDSAGDRAATIARFATQIQRTGAGAVLAGGPGSAEGTGPVAVVRADTAANSTLSTVDNVDTAAGRIVTVMALQEQLSSKAGAYGTAGNAKSPLPEIPAS